MKNIKRNCEGKFEGLDDDNFFFYNLIVVLSLVERFLGLFFIFWFFGVSIFLWISFYIKGVFFIEFFFLFLWFEFNCEDCIIFCLVFRLNFFVMFILSKNRLIMRFFSEWNERVIRRLLGFRNFWVVFNFV